jgi:Spy/CpxP family protein refolding chaperone
MKKGLIVFVALSVALLMSASMLVAQEKASAGKEKGTFKKEMKLTDEQKAKIEDLRTNLRLKMIDLKAEREKLGIALKQEMAKPEPSMQEIEGIIKKLSAVREKSQLAAIGQRLEMRKLLGPDAFKGRFMREGGMPGMMGGGREMPGMGMMMRGEGRSACSMGSWHHRMFRPFGRNEGGSMMGGRTMGRGAAGHMKGGCMDKESCHAQQGAHKDTKCKMEREEKDKDEPED